MHPFPALLIAAALLLGIAPPAADDTCLSSEIGIEPNRANSHADVIFGEAVGQTFVAEGPLIESITVWRVAYEDTNQFGMRLYVTATDSLGRPDISRILSVGPDVYHLVGDGVNPIEFEFVFNPPLVLPGPGTYYFAIQAVPCYGIWDILAVDGVDYYAGGHAWHNGRSFSCSLRQNPTAYPNADVVFRIRFCDSVTPTLKSTWGHLKVIYR